MFIYSVVFLVYIIASRRARLVGDDVNTERYGAVSAGNPLVICDVRVMIRRSGAQDICQYALIMVVHDLVG